MRARGGGVILRSCDAVVAGRHALDTLLHDLHRFEDLVEADLVAIEDVAVLGVDHVEVDLVVREVRLRAAGGPTAKPVERRIGPVAPSASASSVVSTPMPTVRSRQIGLSLSNSLYSLHPPLDLLADLERVLLPTVGKVGGHTTGPDVVVVHPQAGDALEQPERVLAFAPAVDHHRHRAEVHAVRRLEQQVRRHAVELDHQHADPGRAGGISRSSSRSTAVAKTSSFDSGDA